MQAIMRYLLFWLVRLGLRPMLSPRVPARLQRIWIDLTGYILRAPKGLKLQRRPVAEVPTVLVDQACIEPGRAVLYLHGGGYVVGSAKSHARMAGWLGRALRARVWLPEYRCAPEHACPAALQDALAVYRELTGAGQDASGLILAGDSAGGGLALATAVAIRDAGLPLPAALLLFSPWVDLSLSGNSLQVNAARDAMLSASWLRWCAHRYRGAAPATDSRCSPLFADLAGLPPLLIHVGSEEILRDDGERLAQNARAAGVDVSLQCYRGVGHVFQCFAGMLPEADDSIRAAGEFARQKLARG